MRTNRLLASIFSAVAVLAATVAPATAAPAPDPQSILAWALASSTADEDCAYVQAFTITLDGQPGTYTLNDDGTLIQGAPEVTKEDCAGTDAARQEAVAAIDFGVRKEFTSGSRAYSTADSNGAFSAQYTPGAATLIAWGYNVNPVLTAVATGNSTTVVDRQPGNCHYMKVQGAAYVWHGTCINHAFSTNYDLNGTLSFPINVAGVNGHADIAWTFKYLIRSV